MSGINVSVYNSNNPKLQPWLQAFAAGAARGGALVTLLENRPAVLGGADLHVFWGMRNQTAIDNCVARGEPFFCIDHGYTPDRMEFSSVNLNDLNGKSALDLADAAGDPSRCVKHGWRVREAGAPGGWALVVGQIHNDKSLEGNDVYAWAARKVAELRGEWGDRVLFKPHPKEKPAAADRHMLVPAATFCGSMEQALGLAGSVHTYSSTSGPEAWLSGIPATAYSPMSMIYRAQAGDASHEARQRWLNEISYRQYSLEEMAAGLAWDLLAPRALGVAPAGSPGRPCLYPLPTGEFAAEELAA